MDYKVTEALATKTSYRAPGPDPLAAEKPSWWFKRQENTAGSLLYQLPDELLLGICRNLEGSDVYIARQTCNLLRRVLSDDEFVSTALGPQAWVRRQHPFAVPKLAIDWEDVSERLRRRGCCSACIHARIPKRDGADSDFDTTMLRMANDTQWCTACQDWHPWIMFSHNERKSPSPLPSEWLKTSSALWAHTKGGRCIMSEGNVRICPHYGASLEGLSRWILAHDDYAFGEPYWPLRFDCDVCFRELPEPFRSDAVPPSATFHPMKRDRRGVIGSAFVSWTLPLQLDTDTVLKGNWTALQQRAAGEEARSCGGAAKLESALAKAGEAYNDLLCPHARLDDWQTLRDFADHAEEVVSDFQMGYTWLVELEKCGFLLTHSSGQWRRTDDRTICKVCSRRGQELEYMWSLGDHGLRLQRQLELSVPAFDHCSQFKAPYNVWRQLLSPESYDLPEDTELRHITWCPDKQCANGKGWATHLHYLRVIAAHFTMRAGFPSDREGLKRYPPFDRQIDRDFMLRHENASKATSVPHVYRGLRFRPILPWRHPGERHRDITFLSLLW